MFFDFETITSGNTHEPYLWWTYNNDIHQEFIGANNRAIDILSYLPTDKQQQLLIAHNSYYDCIFILPILQNVQPIVESNPCLHIKATYYNPILKNKIKCCVNCSYKLVPMAVSKFGKCV